MNVAIFLCKCDRFEESVRHLLVRCDWKAVVIISQEESYALPCRVTTVTRRPLSTMAAINVQWKHYTHVLYTNITRALKYDSLKKYNIKTLQ